MTTSEVLARVREQFLDDSKDPKLWPDSDLLDYLNDALLELCLETHCLVDSTTRDICRIAVTAGTPSYRLHGQVLKVKRARLTTLGTTVEERSLEWCDENLPSDWESHTGPPKYRIPDLDTGWLRLYPIPAAQDTLALTVCATTPVYSYAADSGSTLMATVAVRDAMLQEIHRIEPAPLIGDQDMEIGIPAQWHRELVHGVAARAYLKQDAETIDSQKSAAHMALWLAFIERARRQMLKQESSGHFNAPLGAMV